ncbi:suppressor of tub2 mutation [Dimargaris cristalligena]|nr:suppressor of tub2 mutation [Dimargaris cristalligena]
MALPVDEFNLALQGSDVEPKLEVLNSLGGRLSVTHESLHLTASDPLISNLGKCLSSSQMGLGLATLNTIPALVGYLSSYQPGLIKYVLQHLLPPMIDRIGDPKRLARDRATQVLADLWKATVTADAKLTPTGSLPPTRPGTPSLTPSVSRLKTPSRTRLPLSSSTPNMSSLGASPHAALMAAFERDVKLKAFQHKSARVREQILAWLRLCNKQSSGFPVKRYVSFAVKLLEDSNEAVREAAKSVLAHLTTTSTPDTLEEISAELRRRNIRTSLVEAVLGKGGLVTPAKPGGLSLRPASREGFHEIPRPKTSLGHGSSSSESFGGSDLPGRGLGLGLDSSLVGRTLRKASDPVPGASAMGSPNNPVAEFEKTASVPPVPILSVKFLDTEIQNMMPCFAGKEGEDNWMQREKAIQTLRGMVRANLEGYTAPFLAHLKNLMDGILKALHSLRTTLQMATTQLIIDLALTLRHRLDSWAELLLHNLLKLCQLTKKISSQAGYQAACVLVRYVTYQPRLFALLSAAMLDKNINLRIYAIGIIKILLESHLFTDGSERAADALVHLNRSLQPALGDASPKVRETAREVYWTYWHLHPSSADTLLSTIDPTTKKQVMREQTKYAHLRRQLAAVVPPTPIGRHSAPASPPQRPVSRSSDRPPTSSGLRISSSSNGGGVGASTNGTTKTNTTLKFASTSGLFSSTSSSTSGLPRRPPKSATGLSTPAGDRSHPPTSETMGSRLPSASYSSNAAPSSTRRHSGGAVVPNARASLPPPAIPRSFGAAKPRSPLSSPPSEAYRAHVKSPSKNGVGHFLPEPGAVPTGRPVGPRSARVSHRVSTPDGPPPRRIMSTSPRSPPRRAHLGGGAPLSPPPPMSIDALMTSSPAAPVPTPDDVFDTSLNDTPTGHHHHHPNGSEVGGLVTSLPSWDLTQTASGAPSPGGIAASPTAQAQNQMGSTPPIECCSPLAMAVDSPSPRTPATARTSTSDVPWGRAGWPLNTPQMIKDGVYYALTPETDEKLGRFQSAGSALVMRSPSLGATLATSPLNSGMVTPERRRSVSPTALASMATSPSTLVLSPLSTSRINNDQHQSMALLRMTLPLIPAGEVEIGHLRQVQRVVRDLTEWPAPASPTTDLGRPHDMMVHLIVACLAALQNPVHHPAYHEETLKVLKLLMEVHGSNWDNHVARDAFHQLLHCQLSQWTGINAIADNCLEVLVHHFPMAQVQYLILNYLVQATSTIPNHVAVGDGDVEMTDGESPTYATRFGIAYRTDPVVFSDPLCLSSCLQLVGAILPKQSWSEIETLLPELAGHIVKATNHSDSHVRRAAIELFALLQVRAELAEEVIPTAGDKPSSPSTQFKEFKGLLTDAQQRLVSMYADQHMR